MKKYMYLCLAVLGIGFLASCKAKKGVEATFSDLDGGWNIVELNGKAMNPAETNQSIEFDVARQTLSGKAGCNRMMGKIEYSDSRKHIIKFPQVATTRMACPDMTVENNVLSALNKVKKYKKLGKENIALCGASNRPIVVLQKKESVSKVSDLEGKWIISEAAGEAIPDGMEKQPFIEFNMAEKRLHGNAGCNLINGAFQVDDENPSAISFPQVISTMMACPDMEVEGRVLKALNSVRSFGKLAGGGVGLYDADNNLVMVLVKN